MDRQQITLKLTMDFLGLKFSVGSFEDRLIMQKAVYLAQAGGVNLGYYYHWYLHGPYCSSLTRDEYAVDYELSQGVNESKDWKLDDESKERLKQLRELIPKGGRREVRRKLELLASVHFLLNRKQVRPHDTREVTMTLERFNKDFTEAEVKDALRELIENGLFTG